MGSKLQEGWVGTSFFYQENKDVEALYTRCQEYPTHFLNSWVKKRPHFFSSVVWDRMQVIHRPPVDVGDSLVLSSNGSIGVKFRLSGLKWPMRQIIGWKRPKKKKWLNNKRVYR